MRATATAFSYSMFLVLDAMRLLGVLALGLGTLTAAQAEPNPSPWTITGVVVRVSDGDTVTVLDAHQQNHKVRLAGIDAPERAQAFGQIARKVLGSTLNRRPVTAECVKQDRYGRSLCTLWLDGNDLGLALIRAGLAWHYTDYIRDQAPWDAARYARAETEARLARRGLWSQSKPTPPWAWRRARTSTGASSRDVATLP